MAVAVLFELAGEGIQEKYDFAVREAAPTGHVPGRLVHVAGPVEGGWRVLDVWQSQEAFEGFLRERLGAALQRAQLPEPKLTMFPVYNLEEVQVAIKTIVTPLRLDPGHLHSKEM